MLRFRNNNTKEPMGFVYIMSNFSRSTLYIGVTRDLANRVAEHKSGKYEDSFTSKYNCVYLVYCEFYDFLSSAIAREKQLKKWNRAWKDELIAKQNPTLKDLYQDFLDGILDL